MRHGTLTRRLTWHDADGRRTESGPAPVRQPQGRASRRPGDRVHRRELVGHARGPLGPGRPSGQRGGAAVPRPGRPPPEDAGPGARSTTRRSTCRSRRRSRRCGSPWRPAPGCCAAARSPRPSAGWSRSPGSWLTSSPSGWSRVARPPSRRSSRSTRPATAPSPRAATTPRLAAAAADDFAELLARHESAWASAWNRFDIELDSANEWTETVLHLHIFHLLQTVSLHTEHLDVGGAGPGLERGGLPRPHLLGRDVRLSVPQLPAPDAGQDPAGVPDRSPRGGAGGGAGGRVRRCDVPVAERLRRARGDPAAAPQPEVRPLAPRSLAPAASRQHRDRLQRVAALHGHREHRFPSFRRRRAADRDRPLLVEHRHVQRRARTATRSSA